MTNLVTAGGRRRAIDALRDQIAPDATDEELLYLAQVGQRYELDPIAGQIVLIRRYDSRLRRHVGRPQITADGRLALAERTGELDGFTGPEWCGPSDTKAGRAPVWVDVWDGDDPPHAARVFVYRKARTYPANGTVRWAEFAQHDNKGDLLATWRQMPAHMLGKVALSLGLRRAFPAVLPGDSDLDDDLTPWENQVSSGPPPLSADSPQDAAPGSGPRPGAAPSRRRSSWEEVPDDVYDNLPEAQGQPDPGRRFTE